jgi:hypothetical protein
MLAEDGALARSGCWSELLVVNERHGNRALARVRDRDIHVVMVRQKLNL